MSAQEAPPADVSAEPPKESSSVEKQEEMEVELEQEPTTDQAPANESITPAPAPGNPNRISKAEHKIIYEMIGRLTALKDEEYVPI